MFNLIYRHYKSKFYEKLVEEFMGEIPDAVSAPAIDWLADRRVLFEKFLSIQAYHIQKARIQSKKSQDFYDGALCIIRAFMCAISQRVTQRTTIVPTIDTQKETKDSLENISEFLKMGMGKKE